MKIRLHPEKLKANLDTLGYFIDLLMIALVVINLSLIIFDWLFQVPLLQGALAQHTPAFHDFYRDTIHENFLFYDLCFVAVYLTEFTIRWIVAVARRTHARWFYFPFLHWYDLLGCIPVGGFRWLRVLRVVSLVLRMQRMGIIDLSQTWLGQTLLRWYSIVVEEISDRVVINVLEGAQREIRTGSPLIHRIETDVLAPRQRELVDYVAGRIVEATQHSYLDYRDRLSDYFSYLTDEAVVRTQAGKRLAAIPVAGPRAIALLGEAVRETGTAFVDQVIDDISSPANRPALDDLINDIITASTGDAEQLNTLIQQTLLDILDEVKTQVAVKQWQQPSPPPEGAG